MPKVAQLRAALALWRGPALADFTYEPFAQGPIAELEELRLSAIEQRIDAELALSRHADVVADLERLTVPLVAPVPQCEAFVRSAEGEDDAAPAQPMSRRRALSSRSEG